MRNFDCIFIFVVFVVDEKGIRKNDQLKLVKCFLLISDSCRNQSELMNKHPVAIL